MSGVNLVYIEFSGCKVNQFERELLAEKFLEVGCHITHNVSDADIIVYNTCCVTERAEKECRQRLNKFHRQNPQAKIIVTGCLAEKEKDALSKLPYVTEVIGNSNKTSLPYFLLGSQSPSLNSQPLTFEFKRAYKDRSRAILKVQDGCDNFCSYCIVPYVRGKPISMPKELVIKNLFNLRDESEVVLTGIHLGKWGKEWGQNLEDLLIEVRRHDFPFRIRLSSLDPIEITDKLLSILKEMKNFCPHFHISLQSASDKILPLMGRRYKVYDFIRTIERIRSYFPLAGIGIDIIVGFPGEDEEAFRETEEVLKGCRIDYMHIFPYSKRAGTKAAQMPNEPPLEVKRERVKRLRELDSIKRREFIERFYNKEVLCLIDKREGDYFRAVTREYLKVYLKENPGHKEFPAKVIVLTKPLAIKI